MNNLQAKLHKFILDVLKEYRVPLVDPCDPDYVGIPCQGTTVSAGDCISDTFCAGVLDFADLIVGNTPVGPFEDGDVEILVTITAIQNGELQIDTAAGVRFVGVTYPLSDFAVTDLGSISLENEVTWSYQMNFLSSSTAITINRGPCSFGVGSGANAGDGEPIVVCD